MDNFCRRLNRQRWEEVCQLEQRSLERNRQMLQQLEEYDRLNAEMTVKTERLKKEREKLLNGNRQNYQEWPNITRSTNQQQLPIFATPLNSNTSTSMHQANMKEFWKKTNGQEWIKRNARTTPVVSSNISLQISSKLNDSKHLERKPKIVIDSPLLASKQISQSKPPIHPNTLIRTKTENMTMLKQTKSVSKDVERLHDAIKSKRAAQSNGHVINVINEDKAVNNAPNLVETQRESVLNTNEVVMEQPTTGTEMPVISQIGLNDQSAIAMETLADKQIHQHAIDSPSLSTIEETPSKDSDGSDEQDQRFNNGQTIKPEIAPMADVVSVNAIGEVDVCGAELIEVDALVIESNSDSNDDSNQNVNDKCEAEELDDNQIMKSNKDIVVEDSSTSPPLDNTRVQSHETTDSQLAKVEAEKELKPSILSFLPSDEDEDDDDDSFFEMSKVAQLSRKSIQEIPTMELQTRAKEEVEDNESSDETEDILSQMGINKGLSQQLVTQNTFAAVETLGLVQQPTETLIKTEINNRPPQLAQKLANYLGRDSSVIGGKSQHKEVEIQKVADKTEDDDFDFFD